MPTRHSVILVNFTSYSTHTHTLTLTSAPASTQANTQTFIRLKLSARSTQLAPGTRLSSSSPPPNAEATAIPPVIQRHVERPLSAIGDHHRSSGPPPPPVEVHQAVQSGSHQRGPCPPGPPGLRWPRNGPGCKRAAGDLTRAPRAFDIGVELERKLKISAPNEKWSFQQSPARRSARRHLTNARRSLRGGHRSGCHTQRTV